MGTPLSMVGSTNQPLTTSGDAITYNVVLGEIKNVGTSLPEIIILIRGLKSEICDAINVAEGVYTTGNTTIPTDTVGTINTEYVVYDTGMDPWPVFSGTAFGNTDDRLWGHRAFCYRQGTSQGYYLAYAVYSR